MMIGDVTVVGLDTSTVVLFDIGMDVPHRVVVTVPADRATVSKDLWRAISQRRLFQLHAGPTTQAPVRPVAPPASPNEWQARCRLLETENARLRARVVELEALSGSVVASPPVVPEVDPTGKLDEILALLRSGKTVVAAGQVPAARSEQRGVVVEVDVPAFIPAEIKPKDIEGRITEVQSETSEATNLGSAASALRKFRRGQ